MPGTGASTVGGTVASKAASEGVISKLGSGVVKLLSNHWGKLLAIVGAGVLVWYLWTSNKSDELSDLGKQINQGNDKNDNNDENDNNNENNINNDENNINNNIDNNYDLSYNNTNVVNQDLKNLYRQELDKYKNTLAVNTINRQINASSGIFFRYEWVIEKGFCLIKLSKFLSDGNPSSAQPIYIFPTNDERVFGFYDKSEKRDLSSMRLPCDLINFVDLSGSYPSGLFGKAFDGRLFSTGGVEKCLRKRFLFEAKDFKNFKRSDGSIELIAFFELIQDNDSTFWNMKNDQDAIRRDIWQQQQKKMMAMNNNGMVNMGNMQPQMMQLNYGMPILGNNQGLNYNMPPNNSMGNNNNQNMGNPQGMNNNGFQGNNNGFPQQVMVNNQQFPQGQGQNNFFNNDGNINFPQK